MPTKTPTQKKIRWPETVPVRDMATLALRNLRLRSARSAFILLTVALGVAMIFGMSISNRGVSQALLDLVDYVVGGADITVRNVTSGQGVPLELLDEFRADADVRLAAPVSRAFAVGVVDRGEGRDPLERRVLLLGVDLDAEPKIRTYEIEEGRLPEPGEENAIAVTRSFLKALKKNVGDEVRLEKDYWKEGDRIKEAGVEAKIVGVVKLEVGAKEFARALAPMDLAWRFNGRNGKADHIDLQLADGADADAAIGRYSDRLGPGYYVMEAQNYANARFFDPMLDLMKYVTTLVSFVALLIGASLINNIFTLTLNRRIREIGILRAVGMTRRQTAGLLLREAGYFGLIGAAAGMVLGLGIAKAMIAVSANMFQTETLPFLVPAGGAAMGFGAGVLVTLFACLKPALAASRISPTDALRARMLTRPTRPRPGLFVLGGALLAASWPCCYLPMPGFSAIVWSCAGILLGFAGAGLLIPFALGPVAALGGLAIRLAWRGEGRLAENSLHWNKSRSVAAVTAAAAAFALALLIGGLQSAADRATDGYLRHHLDADVMIYSENLPLERMDDIRALPGVADADYAGAMLTFCEGKFETIEFVNPDRIGDLVMYQFKAGEPEQALKELAKGDAVFLSARLARKTEKTVGDAIKLQTAKGLKPFKIVGIVFHETGIVASWGDMECYFNQGNFNVVVARAAPGESVAALQTAMEQVIGSENLRWSTTFDELKELYRKGTARAAAVFKASYFIALLVVGVSVFNALYLNVLERTQEIGVMRAIGATQRQIRRIVFCEATLVALVGAVIGIAMGVYLMRGFLNNMEQFFGFKFTFAFPWSAAGQAMLLALFLAVAAGLYPAIRAAKMKVVEALRYE